MAVKIDLSGIKPLLSSLMGGDSAPGGPPASAPDAPQTQNAPPSSALLPYNPPPTPAAAGFGQWYSDPQNMQKLSEGVQSGGQPMQTPSPSMFGGTPQSAPQTQNAPPSTALLPYNPPPSDPFAGIKPLPGVAAPAAAPATAADASLMGSVRPMQGVPSPTAQAPMDPLAARLAADQALQAKYQTEGAGLNKIKNPVLRTLARIGDAAGTVLAPGVMSVVPGTTVHNWTLQNLAGANVASDQANLKGATEQADLQAQADQRRALATQEQAKAQALLTPKPEKPVKPSTIEEQAYDFAVKSGKSPLDALAAVYGAKDTKNTPTKTLPEQYLEAMASGDATKAALIRKTIQDTNTQPKIDIRNSTPSGASLGLPPSSPGNPSPYIQSIIDGRTPAPNSRSKAGAAIMAQVTAADPTYDASRYNTYQAMQKEMTSGKTGANINALNTLLNHVADARKNLPNNGSMSLLNTVENAGSRAFGNNPTGKFDTDAVGIGGEFGKLVSGGVATVDEQKHLQTLLDNTASPKTLNDNLDEIENLAHGKLQGIMSQINSAQHPGKGSNGPSSVPGGVAPTSGLAGSLPTAAASQLQEGVAHTFGNGQTWTKQNGKAVRLK